MTELLRLAGVRAGYGETVVLEDVAFSLAERSSLAVLGRNGVGKTTLLATIMGHTSFHAGSIEFKGKPVSQLPAHQRNRIGIGYVPQAREIFPSLIIAETLLKALERLIREESLTVVLVEQHTRLALQVTEAALVLNRGRVAHHGPSAALLRDPE